MLSPFEYVLKNNIIDLTKYLENNSPNIVDDRGKSLLDYAIKAHNNEIFQLLLKYYINLNIVDDLGNTCYHYAVINNRLGYLKQLLKLNGNANVKNNKGQTPLYLACLYGRYDIVRLYLEYYDIDLGETDNNDETIFMALVRSENLELIELFNDYDKYIEVSNYIGDTPLCIATKINSVKMVEFLISKGAFVNSKNNFNETPLFSAIGNNNQQIVGILLKHGAILDIKNKFGETVFNEYLDKEMIEFINDKELEYDLKSYERIYPLHYYIYLNDFHKINEYLVTRYINVEDPFGYTPLDLAIKYKEESLIKRIKDGINKAKIQVLKKKNNK